MPTFPVLKRVNGMYGPTMRNHYYKPMYYHRRMASPNPHKSIWCIKEYEEYGVFKLADEENWHCTVEKGLFSILNKGTYIVGNEDEILSFFWIPSNLSDPWHGFPVKSGDKRPSSDLLDKWMKDGVIEHSARIRIERGLL